MYGTSYYIIINYLSVISMTILTLFLSFKIFSAIIKKIFEPSPKTTFISLIFSLVFIFTFVKIEKPHKNINVTKIELNK